MLESNRGELRQGDGQPTARQSSSILQICGRHISSLRRWSARGDATREVDYQRLIEQILAVQPGNLAALLDLSEMSRLNAGMPGRCTRP